MEHLKKYWTSYRYLNVNDLQKQCNFNVFENKFLVSDKMYDELINLMHVKLGSKRPFSTTIEFQQQMIDDLNSFRDETLRNGANI